MPKYTNPTVAEDMITFLKSANVSRAMDNAPDYKKAMAQQKLRETVAGYFDKAIASKTSPTTIGSNFFSELQNKIKDAGVRKQVVLTAGAFLKNYEGFQGQVVGNRYTDGFQAAQQAALAAKIPGVSSETKAAAPDTGMSAKTSTAAMSAVMKSSADSTSINKVAIAEEIDNLFKGSDPKQITKIQNAVETALKNYQEEFLPSNGAVAASSNRNVLNENILAEVKKVSGSDSEFKASVDKIHGGLPKIAQHISSLGDLSTKSNADHLLKSFKDQATTLESSAAEGPKVSAAASVVQLPTHKR